MGCRRKQGMAVVIVSGHTTRLTTSPARMAAREKTHGSLDITRGFGNPRPWDFWFGGMQGREDKAAFHGAEG